MLQTGGTSTVIYLLVDNIDYLPSTSTFPSQINVLTTSSPSFTSALRLAIDKGNLFVIATCTDVQAVDPSFIHNYRLGKAIELKLPTKQDREVIIRKFLLGSSIGLHNDVTASTFPTDTPQSDSFSKTFFTMVARELALRTQGCSACDVLKFLREQYQLAIIQSYCVCLPQQQLQSQSQLRTSNDETVMDETSYVKLSVNQLLQASTQLSPAALMSSAKGAVHNFVRQIDFDAAEPVLVGVDDVKQQLLRCISTIIPEVITSEKSNFRPSLRKCSGAAYMT